MLLPFLSTLNCIYWVSLMHFICINRSQPCSAPDFRTHGSLHQILAHLFFLFNCCYDYCCCFICMCCCLLLYSSLEIHGISVWSCFNCSISLEMWTIFSLVMPMRSLCLHFLCRFLHHFHHLFFTYYTTRTFIPPGPQLIGWIVFLLESYDHYHVYLRCCSDNFWTDLFILNCVITNFPSLYLNGCYHPKKLVVSHSPFSINMCSFCLNFETNNMSVFESFLCRLLHVTCATPFCFFQYSP